LTDMELTDEQVAFLADLRNGACPAVAALDASMIGPLIRANLVRWDDDPAESAKRQHPPGTAFTLTDLGEQCLVELETGRQSTE
jgi:hypothetical protein